MFTSSLYYLEVYHKYTTVVLVSNKSAHLHNLHIQLPLSQHYHLPRHILQYRLQYELGVFAGLSEYVHFLR